MAVSDTEFECEFCYEWFADKELLKEHVKQTHPFDYDNWFSGLAAAGLAISQALIEDDLEFGGFPSPSSNDDSNFGGGSFSGGGASGEW